MLTVSYASEQFLHLPSLQGTSLHSPHEATPRWKHQTNSTMNTLLGEVLYYPSPVKRPTIHRACEHNTYFPPCVLFLLLSFVAL